MIGNDHEFMLTWFMWNIHIMQILLESCVNNFDGNMWSSLRFKKVSISLFDWYENKWMNVWMIISLIVLVHDSHAHIPIFKSH